MSRTSFAPVGVFDMSTGGSRSATVKVIVGTERREFSISQLLMDAKSIRFSTHGNIQGEIGTGAISNGVGTSREIILPDDDAVAFNLFVQWLHGYRLPQAETQAQRTQQCQQPITLDGMLAMVPESVHFSPTFVREASTFDLWDIFQHISSSYDYMRYSPEEIRLSNMLRSLPSIAPSSQPQSMESTKGTVTTHVVIKREHSPALDTPAEKKQKTNVPSANDQIQLLLLKLAILAQKYGWSECFNATIESYRAGEKMMDRTYPVLSHIQLVYSADNSTHSPATRLLTDYAFYKGAQSGISRYHTVFVLKPAFMGDYHSRLDGEVTVPGCKILRSQGRLTFSISFPGPLDGEYTQHYHMAG